MKKDDIDNIIEQWANELPELDASPMAVWGRIKRTVKHSERRLADNFSLYQLNSGEFDVLATLRRSGQEFKLKPTDLYQSLMITSGAITNRIDTLEKKGLVKRVHDNEDRRTIYVQLTDAGYERISQAVISHTRTEESLLKGLTKEELAQLDQLLKKLLYSLENQ
ncbi:MarR family transcriptional regulator [Clostridium boliviensis]|uniref:MarR family transcriptional regulator n=1 Tax=Clostridium boliviensis TaxID=318465 RepID=A0ABU4GSK7_9CLOT|nr:MarR family transcriptional regulator [Clostridium boliviensis]MDW2800624.1 MarR family transcriptional regulator [Clostridium boliviensis]